MLPQEVGAFRAAVRPERRRAFIQELAAQCTTALQLLTTCLGSPVHGAREQARAARRGARLAFETENKNGNHKHPTHSLCRKMQEVR